MRVERFQSLPSNIDAFVREISEEFGALYGVTAATHYRNNAAEILAANIRHPDIRLWLCFEGVSAVGFLLGACREQWNEISFMHVLRPFLGRGVEDALLAAAVNDFRATRAPKIVSDWVPMTQLRLDDAFARLGFERIDRIFMSAPVNTPALAHPAGSSVALDEPYFIDAAECLVRAYENNPWAHLHPEIENLLDALEFVQRAASGGYGQMAHGYLRAVWNNDTCAGVILGSAITPDTGFVLQVAVDPAHRRKGLGAELIRSLNAEFHQSGLTQITLGVTAANPAARLYQQLGFEARQPTSAYVWRATRATGGARP